MKSIKKETEGEISQLLTATAVLAVNPRVTFRWSSRSAEDDNRSRQATGGKGDESVVLSTFGTEERALLALADGRRSIDDLARLAGMPIAVALKHLRTLHERGIVIPSDRVAKSQPAEPAGNWTSDMLAPRAITDALMSGPVEYDYASPSEADAPASSGSGPTASKASPPELLPRSGVIVAASETVEGSGSNASGRATSPGSSSGDPSGPARKLGTDPNRTLFWSPSPTEAASPSNVLAGPAPSSVDGLSPNAPRKKAGSGDVVVVGGPASSGQDASSTQSRKKAGSGDVVVVGGPASTGHHDSSTQPRRKAGSGDVVVVGGPAPAASDGSGRTPVAAAAAAEAAKPSVGVSKSPATASTTGTADVPAPVVGVVSAPIPPRVGGYEVAMRIAQGAMGSIYVCRRVGAAGFQRLFTLKVVRQHSTQKEQAIKSFMREARIGALLNHPNVQMLVDVGDYENQPFLILDYIEGMNFSDLLSDDRRPGPPVVVGIILDVLRGLQHVHELTDEQGERLGLVHGDVSPQNILVGVDGSARLTDFGSARFSAEGRVGDSEPVAAGKPAYMAPEQLLGEATDARTDLFSVGVVMWTALTGQKLFAADTYDQTVVKVMRRKIPPPSEFGSPPFLDAIIQKALSRSPDGRYASADEMARDIQAVLAAENVPVLPRDVGAWVRKELGETLADRRRKIQDLFGGAGKPSDSQVRVQIPRPHRPTPKTADGFERLPAKTIQIEAVDINDAIREAAAMAPAPAHRSSPHRQIAKKPSRGQWALVIVSAVMAGCALIVAVAYLLSSIFAPEQRSPTRPAVGSETLSAPAGAPTTLLPPTELPPKPSISLPSPAPVPATPPGRKDVRSRP